MKKSYLILIIIFSISYTKAFSCQCKEYEKDSLRRISYEVSDIVFLGELISTNPENSTYQFKIYETFKGIDTFKIITGAEFTNCSIVPYPKGLWLVYANFVQGDTIDISSCLASRSISMPVLFPPDPPSLNNEEEKTLQQEIEILKRDLEREKIQREAIIDLYTEIEKLRYMKKNVNR